jgi:hypothetical protein
MYFFYTALRNSGELTYRVFCAVCLKHDFTHYYSSPGYRSVKVKVHFLTILVSAALTAPALQSCNRDVLTLAFCLNLLSKHLGTTTLNAFEEDVLHLSEPSEAVFKHLSTLICDVGYKTNRFDISNLDKVRKE